AGELARVYVDAQRERREQKRAAATDSMTEKPEQAGPLEQRGRRLGAEFQELAVIRAVLSERQLYEVMVDFWANHFNVFFAKGADRFLTPSYIEQTIRPRALGKFADLLIATAERPARRPANAVLRRQLGGRGARCRAAAGDAAAPPTTVRPTPAVRPPATVRSGTRSDARGLAAPPGARARAQGHQRELRPRATRAAHAGRGWRLHPAGRDQRRADIHGLERAATAAGRGL